MQKPGFFWKTWPYYVDVAIWVGKRLDKQLIKLGKVVDTRDPLKLKSLLNFWVCLYISLSDWRKSCQYPYLIFGTLSDHLLA